MKILNIHGNKSGLLYANGTPKGGLEKVILETLSLSNDEVLFETVCNRSDKENQVSGLIPINPEFDSPVWNSNKLYKEYTDKIINLIYEGNYTHLILHGANRLAKYLNKKEIPYLFIDHQSYTSVNKLYHENHFTQTVPEARKLGSRFYTVSKFNSGMVSTTLEKQKIVSDFLFDGWIKFQYANEELKSLEVKPHSDFGLTIGRADKDKNPHLIKKFSGSYPYVIITMLSGNKPGENEYFEKHLANDPNVLANISRKQTLDFLCRSSYFVSTCHFESAGITALESVCAGIPIALLTKFDNHSSLMFAPENSQYMKLMGAPDEEWIEWCLSLGVLERRRIKEEAIEHNKKEYVLDSLITELSKLPSLPKQGGYLELFT